MRKLLILFILLSVISCKKDPEVIAPPVAPRANLTVIFQTEVDGKAVELGGNTFYTNADGNQYALEMLKYYISHLSLISSDGKNDYLLENHDLVDPATPGSEIMPIDTVLNGQFDSLRFYLGVDYEHNHKGDQRGDLDPINGMIWTWNTGYIFFKQEGPIKKGDGSPGYLVYHYGSDPALIQVSIPLNKMEVKGVDRKIYIKFNLNDLYGNPNKVDFDVDYFRQSSLVSDLHWLSQLEGNFPGAFSLGKIE
jgi:hypothetical protein